eukprot:TRINITY_DN3296_c1_g2_i1.p1 TRINITY_DN3296_c1_g2~~TRINITY_DN3296_c1_g2_i1.p1  ORF type:complete len:291 (-),score=40.16 TRINITY_DN3296_c1_g2_i1:429-1301(-)
MEDFRADDNDNSADLLSYDASGSSSPKPAISKRKRNRPGPLILSKLEPVLPDSVPSLSLGESNIKLKEDKGKGKAVETDDKQKVKRAAKGCRDMEAVNARRSEATKKRKEEEIAVTKSLKEIILAQMKANSAIALQKSTLSKILEPLKPSVSTSPSLEKLESFLLKDETTSSSLKISPLSFPATPPLFSPFQSQTRKRRKRSSKRGPKTFEYSVLEPTTPQTRIVHTKYTTDTKLMLVDPRKHLVVRSKQTGGVLINVVRNFFSPVEIGLLARQYAILFDKCPPKTHNTK